MYLSGILTVFKIIGKPFLVWWNRKHELLLFYCDLKFCPSDGRGVIWYEPVPVVTTSNPNEEFPSVIQQVFVESSVTLTWSYNLSSSLRFGLIKFNGVGVVSFKANSSANPVKDQFKGRFNVSSTPGRISLSISPVTVGDDGKYICQLFDSNPDTWQRAIHVQVVGKLKSIFILLTLRKAYLNCSILSYPILPSGLSLNAGRT